MQSHVRDLGSGNFRESGVDSVERALDASFSDQLNWKTKHTVKDESCFDWLMQRFTLSPPARHLSWRSTPSVRDSEVPKCSHSIIHLRQPPCCSWRPASSRLKPLSEGQLLQLCSNRVSWFIDRSSQQLDWFPTACESQGIFNLIDLCLLVPREPCRQSSTSISYKMSTVHNTFQ